MIWLAAVATVCVAALVIFALVASSQHRAHQDEMLAEFRALNSALVQGRFGTSEPAASGTWHRVLASEERLIVAAGTRALLGLQHALTLEDEHGQRWRVVAAHQLGTNPYLDVRELEAEPMPQPYPSHQPSNDIP
ncbi:hypothetical protein [Ramlibacter sp. WS9]|uniref:hypothetical protein n=1 Tax=Ramlibacter sp. WS9 TaxID=1882741 RepID=UPI0011428D80|nr:hypothetical protein [Ramlibacter sp. WS9]ROZ78669.1 hypothetical protein EEB15_02965 [Ramlibacter sp. WS9]